MHVSSPQYNIVDFAFSGNIVLIYGVSPPSPGFTGRLRFTKQHYKEIVACFYFLGNFLANVSDNIKHKHQGIAFMVI